MLNVAVVGTGVVGSAFAMLLKSKGYNISGVCSKNGASADSLAGMVGASAFSLPEELVDEADVIFITTPDRVINELAQNLAQATVNADKKMFFHASGALPAEVLLPLKERGGLIGSIHPLQSFAGLEQAMKNLKGSFFALQGDPQAMKTAYEIVEALDGVPYIIKEEDKALYHLGACVASNYLVSLVHYAVKIFNKIGIDDKQAQDALLPLIKGTLNNIETMGPVKALTGPVVRGDADTVKRHLKALAFLEPELGEFYGALGEYTCKIALEKKTINDETCEKMSKIFKKGADDIVR